LSLLRRSFDDQITSACFALVPASDQIEKLGTEGAYSAQFERSKSSFEQLFRRIALAVPQDGSLTLLILDPRQDAFHKRVGRQNGP
jgi:hypothetical protein